MSRITALSLQAYHFIDLATSATWYADSSRSWDLYIPIQEDELHQRAEAAYGDLVADVKQYDAMPEEAAVAQLETEAKPLLKQRREAARGLEEGLAAFLKSQVRLATCLENGSRIQSLDYGLGLANWLKQVVLLEEARPSAFGGGQWDTQHLTVLPFVMWRPAGR